MAVTSKRFFNRKVWVGVCVYIYTHTHTHTHTYVHKLAVIKKQFCYFNTVYIKKSPDENEQFYQSNCPNVTSQLFKLYENLLPNNITKLNQICQVKLPFCFGLIWITLQANLKTNMKTLPSFRCLQIIINSFNMSDYTIMYMVIKQITICMSKEWPPSPLLTLG
jgi:hypothetical protein